MIKKRQDTDIFGAKSEPVAPRIQNNTYVDPNAAFNKKMEENYNAYKNKVQKNQQVHFRNTRTDFSKVNEEAQFDQNYHKYRKDMDMQSSIFYPPTISNSSRVSMVNTSITQMSQSVNNFDPSKNYGRKQTLNRQVTYLHQNGNSQIRGNSSGLFGLSDRIQSQQYKNQHPIQPLIPHYMKWEDYDSVRYGGNRKQENQNGNIICGSSINNISQSNSTIFEKNDIPKAESAKNNPQQSLLDNMKGTQNKDFKKKKGSQQIKQIIQPPVHNQNNMKQANLQNKNDQVEIKILSGWNTKFLQGLTKHCKLNSTPLVRFEQGQNGKVTISLKKTKKWENVTQWLRKDAKLKMRVFNN